MIFGVLNRYILKELIVPFLLTLLVLTFTLISGNLIKLSDMIINKGVGIFAVLKILAFYTPYLLSYSLPMSLLVAVLVTFGRLSQDGEITALRSSGVHIFRIFLPVFVLALGLSFYALFVNNALVASSHWQVRKLLVTVGYDKPEALLEPGKFIDTFGNYVFYIKEIEGKEAEQIIIYETLSDGQTVRTITAKTGTIEVSDDRSQIVFKLRDGSADEPDPEDPSKFYKMHFKTFPLMMDVGDVKRGKFRYKRLKEMNLQEIRNEVVQLKKKGLSPLRYMSEYHRKISFAFASFVFVLLAAPLAIRRHRVEKSSNLAYALILVFSYYLLLSLGKSMAQEGTLPPMLAMWMPNVLLGILGFVLLFKIQKV